MTYTKVITPSSPRILSERFNSSYILFFIKPHVLFRLQCCYGLNLDILKGYRQRCYPNGTLELLVEYRNEECSPINL